jgi:hypothetical protein
MSVPLSNLYNWVESLLPDPAVLYVFHPHGSKKISNCNWLRDYDVSNVWRLPGVIMHDQEPLDWEYYNLPTLWSDVDILKKRNWPKSPFLLPRIHLFENFNLKSLMFIETSTAYDNVILVHSEKNSQDLSMYEQNGYVCVHYWAHAVIARDWFRFAKHDIALNQIMPLTAKFLIYCRDWSHRREYRLKFLELLVKKNLHHASQTSVMHTNSEGVHFAQHKFDNPAFELDNPELLTHISQNEFSSNVSATYDYLDFLTSEISVVLETVFDGSRIHLTEKILRPIACGHPFILVAGPGALEYLRSYGFKTFAPWIDESYDLENNSLKRLEKIVQSMIQIQNLQGQELRNFSKEIKQIAEFNKAHFFSDEFFNQVKDELKNNLMQANQQVRKSRGKQYLKVLSLAKNCHLLDEISMRQEKTQFVRQLRRSYPHDPTNPQKDPSV